MCTVLKVIVGFYLRGKCMLVNYQIYIHVKIHFYSRLNQ